MISFQNGPVMAQVTYAEFLTWIADRLEHVHGERPNVDYMLRLRELAASVVPADADRPDEIFVMKGAGVEALRAAREALRNYGEVFGLTPAQKRLSKTIIDELAKRPVKP